MESYASAIGQRQFNPKIPVLWYVANLPGHGGGVDWEYTRDFSRAIDLSPYWQRRFMADMRRIGDTTARLVKCKSSSDMDDKARQEERAAFEASRKA